MQSLPKPASDSELPLAADASVVRATAAASWHRAWLALEDKYAYWNGAGRYAADDLVCYDYPAAVDKVRSLSSVESIQVVCQGCGAIAFHRSMLAGLPGARPATRPQAGALFKVQPPWKVRSGPFLDSLLDGLGVDSPAAYGDEHDDWLERLYNRTIQLNLIIERAVRCDNSVCRRATFLYGHHYVHDLQNPATHEDLHEMHGITSMSHSRHLSALTRAGHSVTAAGEDTFLPHLERLAIPNANINGAEDEARLPENTALTLNWLRENNDRLLTCRHLVTDYGHCNSSDGQRATVDVCPIILNHLEQTA